MFSRDRFSLSRFSLGSQDNIIPIEMTLVEELRQVAGVAVPVQTTAFFNDVVRGTLRGAIAMKSTFESSGTLLADCTMNANINFAFVSEEAIYAFVEGSQNSNIVTTLTETLERIVYGSKILPRSSSFSDALFADTYGVKDIQISNILNEVLTSMLDASSQSTEITRIDITLPPGSEIRIDSETYRVIMDGDNVLYAQNGDWLTLTRELLYIDVESASGGELLGTLIYTERYL